MLEIEERGIGEELHSDEQSADRRFSFIGAIYNYFRYHQYKFNAAPRLELVVHGARISSQNKGRE